MMAAPTPPHSLPQNSHPHGGVVSIDAKHLFAAATCRKRDRSVVRRFILTVAVLFVFPCFCNALDTDAFVNHSRLKFGESGAKAAQFLLEQMPESDKGSVSTEMLNENLDLAFAARESFPWGKDIPEDIFQNDVLPYACLDEARLPWREALMQICKPMVANSHSPSEAAQLLNRDLFKRINVHYSTERKKPNQCPQESIELGKASCTGLSILLVDACRAVGIPARIAGVAQWTTKAGNHTWVEVWDHGWHFLGADEYDPKGLDHAWFVEDASKAIAGDRAHAVYAASWRKSCETFPLAWAADKATVPAIDVTSRYLAQVEASQTQKLYVRVWDRKRRISVPVELRDNASHLLGQGITKSETADMNDMLSFDLARGANCFLRLKTKQGWREATFPQVSEQTATIDIDLGSTHPISKNLLAIEDCIEKSASLDSVADLKLNNYEAERAKGLLWEVNCKKIAAGRSAEMEKRAFEINGLTLQWKEKVFGAAPPKGHSLWISLHGGGGAPKEVNDEQWENQANLYEPSEGIYLAPRASTDSWNMWHQDHIDPMFDRLIADYVVLRHVDPNRVYIMGYSAGGDGVYMLGPRMADRWAAASMMAGHPNDASPLSLRNIPFFIFAGANDTGYNRNVVAAEWGRKLDELQKADPEGYLHQTTIYEGLGHWMDRKDAIALKWMAPHTRKPWPHTVVWCQLNVPTTRFYWLSLAKEEAKKGQYIRAVAEGQTIRIETRDVSKITLRLSGQLVDLEKPIAVYLNGKLAYQGTLDQTIRAIQSSLDERADFDSIASATLQLECK